jgi:hypothetical protein
MTRIRSLSRLLLLLFALAIAALLGAPAWAAYVIYVQGTNSLSPFKPNAPITTIFNGAFNAGNTVQTVSYPATLGLLSLLSYKGGFGLLPPTLNKSVAIGVTNLNAMIEADQAANPNEQIYVIGFSQGAIVGTQEALALQKLGPAAYQDITFILPGNPDRAAPSGGGLLTQIPFTIRIPFVATFGGGVLSATPPTNGPTIVDVTNQGDPFANFNPAHLLTFLGGLFQVLFGSSSPHSYTDTVLTPAMVTSGNYAPGYVVTKTGNLTDVFIPSTTPSPAPHQPVQKAPPVKAFQLVSAIAQPSMSTPKPVAMQQATKPIRAELASIKPTNTDQQLAGLGGKHK